MTHKAITEHFKTADLRIPYINTEGKITTFAEEKPLYQQSHRNLRLTANLRHAPRSPLQELTVTTQNSSSIPLQHQQQEMHSSGLLRMRTQASSPFSRSGGLRIEDVQPEITLGFEEVDVVERSRLSRTLRTRLQRVSQSEQT